MNREGSVVVKNRREYDAKHKTRNPNASPIARLASLRLTGPQCHQICPSAWPNGRVMRIERNRITRGVTGSKTIVSNNDTSMIAIAFAAGFHRPSGDEVS